MRSMFNGRMGMTLAFVLGLAIATAGSATAARLITGKQVKDGSITAKDLSKSLRRQIARTGTTGPAGPAGAAGAAGPAGSAGGYTKADADARFLATGATGADSAKLGGKTPGDYVQGGGFALFAETSAARGGEATMFDIPGLGSLKVTCSSTGQGTVAFRNAASVASVRIMKQEIGNLGAIRLSNNDVTVGYTLVSTAISPADTAPTVGTAHLATSPFFLTVNGATVWSAVQGSASAQTACRGQAQALTGSQSTQFVIIGG
jgi:hypothetical protein